MGSCSASGKNNIITQKNIYINRPESKVNYNENNNTKIVSQKPSNEKEINVIKFQEEEKKEKKKKNEEINRKANHRKTVSVGDTYLHIQDKLINTNISDVPNNNLKKEKEFKRRHNHSSHNYFCIHRIYLHIPHINHYIEFFHH